MAVVAVSSSSRKSTTGVFVDGITTRQKDVEYSVFSRHFFGSVDVATVVVFGR